MSAARLSFVVPAKDAAAWLAEAVSSCLTQKGLPRTAIEVVVVDDGSVDSTPRLLRWLATKDDRVVALRREGVGRAAARNYGIERASAPVLAVLDADDLAETLRASRTLAAMAKGADVVYGDAMAVDAFGRDLGRILSEEPDWDRARKEGANRIVHSTMAYTKGAWAKAGGYEEHGAWADLGLDDWHFQWNLFLNGARFARIPEALGAYRITEAGVSATRDPAKVAAAKAEFFADRGIGVQEVKA